MEIYVSTDCETLGPIPGCNSLLSFGSAAFTPDGKLLDTFTANLEELEGAVRDPNTEKWWATQPEAWAKCRTNLVQPSEAMKKYVHWVNNLNGTPVFVAYPAGFDFLFMYWYMIRFTGKSPFSFSALDMKTFAMATLGTDYRFATKKNFPRSWFGKKKHNHCALDDAIEQGEMFINMLKQSRFQSDLSRKRV